MIRPVRKSGKVVAVIGIACALLLVANDAFARRIGGFSSRSFGSFGSSRSFSSRALSSRSSGSSRSLFGSSTRSRTSTTRNTLSGTRGVSSRSNTRNVSATQYARARASGTTFQTRGAAESAFRQRNSGQFPSRYASQPSARPGHIPQSTRVDGRSVNVTYNSRFGGYGYLHPALGTFVLYSALGDAAMMSVLMSRGGYYYGPGPGAYGGGGGFWTGLILIGLIGGVVFLFRSSRRG